MFLRKTYITRLPDELLMSVMLQVKPHDIANCVLVSRKWNDIVKSQHFWHQLALRDFPEAVAQEENKEHLGKAGHHEKVCNEDSCAQYSKQNYSSSATPKQIA